LKKAQRMKKLTEKSRELSIARKRGDEPVQSNDRYLWRIKKRGLEISSPLLKEFLFDAL